ncbi:MULTISPECIES: hypothetical protein [Streptomyces]|uniref:Uncharacterized protein n=1 Tax=Streptomyces koelreuteriae TaxID=2838015 RepID=A0ABX8FRP5_9ACTN|nr:MULTISPECIES: hypothetical protein [Streptomyces]QWB23798.1 hypothetical protein KJK29_15010 [Streptomyces koelreuteriae]UUA06777.1 hypothetical protein NNW98_15080 [Streptomyces koelreuteriae]UUA14406.1 hypothetical protein NNW99_15075 [Streptomyces sp. CRCS-T-1]
MTRPSVRMCTRCERSTNEPIPIRIPLGKSPTRTGPGLTIYACQECVTHSPPLQEAVELLESTHPRSRMTLHVCKVNAKGTVTEDHGKVEILAGGPHEPVPYTSTYPPCACPRCGATR